MLELLVSFQLLHDVHDTNCEGTLNQTDGTSSKSLHKLCLPKINLIPNCESAALSQNPLSVSHLLKIG